MKRLLRDMVTLCALLLLTFLLDRAGVYASLAARLEPKALTEAEAGLSMESAAYVPPERAAAHPGKVLPLLPAFVPETPAPSPVPVNDSTRPLPSVHSGGRTQVDYRSLLEAGWDCDPAPDGPQILILHTHSCEAYTPEPGEPPVKDDFRTLDTDHSVVAVGDTLTSTLESMGFSVVHDRSLYDYPSYNGAYDRSGAAVESWLREYPSLRVVIDLHRDSLGGKRTEYLLPDGSASAQVMLLLTTGENGLYHPEWKRNLTLGLEIQSEMEYRYPGLARPLYLSPARYNQQLCAGSFLAEIGTEANSLSEAKRAAAMLGECIGAVLGRK